MIEWQILFLGLFIIVLLVSRVISEKASAMLSDNQRETLARSFSSFRKITIFPLLGVIVLYYFGLKLFPAHENAVSTVSFILLFLYVLVVNAVIFRKMSILHLPPAYVRRIILARVLLYGAVGFVIFFLWMTAGEL